MINHVDDDDRLRNRFEVLLDDAMLDWLKMNARRLGISAGARVRQLVAADLDAVFGPGWHDDPSLPRRQPGATLIDNPPPQ